MQKLKRTNRNMKLNLFINQKMTLKLKKMFQIGLFKIMTGNAHKESCHKLFLILVREQELYITKTDCSGKNGGCFHN